MTTEIIHVSQDYRLHVTVKPVAALPGYSHFKIQSQLLSAKYSEGLQTQYEATLRRDQLLEIAYHIVARA